MVPMLETQRSGGAPRAAAPRDHLGLVDAASLRGMAPEVVQACLEAAFKPIGGACSSSAFALVDLDLDAGLLSERTQHAGCAELVARMRSQYGDAWQPETGLGVTFRSLYQVARGRSLRILLAASEQTGDSTATAAPAPSQPGWAAYWTEMARPKCLSN